MLVTGTYEGLLPVFLLFGTPFFVVGGQFVNWFGFTVADSPDGLRLRFGLTSHRSQTVPPGRLQAVRLQRPVMWRRQGWVRVVVNVAGAASGENAEDRPSMLLPVAPEAVARAVLSRVLPGVDVLAIPLDPAPRRARWRAPLQHRRLAAGADDRVFVTRQGWLVPTWDVVPHARTQSVRVTQGPWQRRLGLASVHVDSTPGPVRITAAQRPAPLARSLAEDQVGRARRARAAADPDRWLSGGTA
jgi:putative membrane protein